MRRALKAAARFAATLVVTPMLVSFRMKRLLLGAGDLSIPMREQRGIVRRVRIGAGAWIGANSVVMADVGADSIVGAGAVVTKSIPPGVKAAGVPARVVGARDHGPHYAHPVS